MWSVTNRTGWCCPTAPAIRRAWGTRWPCVASCWDEASPLLGICLGHQILARPPGASTSRLKFGHHGGNHPVRDETHAALCT